MNYARIALAFLGAIVAYFVSGFVMFGALSAMKSEFMKYPNVYRSHDGMMKVMPYNVATILISIVVVAVLYAKIYPAGGGVASGVQLGALIGIFSVCTSVLHNYVRSYPMELEALREVLPKIQTPVQIIAGRRDRVVPPVNAEYLHERLPLSELHLLDCGHFAWEDAADEYADLVEAWWAEGYSRLPR